MDNRRVVVTGLGLVCALGENVGECWSAAVNGVTGIREVKSVNTDGCYANVGAEVAAASSELSGEDYDRSSLLCIKAAGEALADAGYEVSEENSDRIGVIVGNCVGGAASIDKYFTDELKNGGGNKSDILKMPAAAIANNVAKHFGLNGTTANIVNACAAGTISLAYAADLIRAGKADAFVAGGSDSFSSLAFAGFHALHALDERSCSPFNRSSGITLGEGAGVLIIESYEHAKARGAKIYCEVLGSGVSSDAHHITAPDPEGKGQMLAINRAIANSGLTPNDIDYINAHGTGTAKNDEAEFLSLHTIFDGNDHLSVSSTKSMTGHCLGAAGSIEAVLTVKAVCENAVPPTVGYAEEDLGTLKEKAGAIDFVPNTKRERTINYAASNSFAFGGNNASIVFAKEPREIPDRTNGDKIYVTGIGGFITKGRVDITADDYKRYGIKMAFYRKLDRFSQLQLLSGMQALDDAKITVSEENERDIGIVVGTADGPMTEIVGFQKNVIENGTANGSAFSFPNTVYNAAGGYFSIFAGIKGYNVTNANSIQAGLQSLCYAADVIRNGDERIMVASGTDENTDTTEMLYGKLGLPTEKLGEGSVSIILENEKSARERGAKIYAELAGWATAHKSVEFGTVKGSESALKKVIEEACKSAGVELSDVQGLFGFANGIPEIDELESRVFGEMFGDKPVVVHVRDDLGEGRAAAAAGQAAAAARYLSLGWRNMECALAVGFGAGGSYSAVVLKRVAEKGRITNLLDLYNEE
ncbi:MAG: beta-ketoacyl-[acyl-carrier-protein] synthase family protein [Lachnospiraceae bacterium]|nr:beta-ketoacyl-[acyl-carrier-protein] synthase family protein [Ruminococcus sp.]MCM1275249.1 beta-ketoacyl-[acyl-carrier-protein] synthase family protein [Lachnospiraceae bacterium]